MMMKQKDKEKSKGYLIKILPSVKVKAHKKALDEGKSFSQAVEELLKQYGQ